jgi:hypothetical protein
VSDSSWERLSSRDLNPRLESRSHAQHIPYSIYDGISIAITKLQTLFLMSTRQAAWPAW